MRRKKTNTPTEHSPDMKLITITVVLSILGIIAIADASAPYAIRNFGDKFHFVKNQIMWIGIGTTLMYIVSKIHYRMWNKYAVLLFGLSIAGLFTVFIPGIGNKVYGANRWIYFGGFSFQPSELVKLTLTLYFAKVAEKQKVVAAYIVPLAVVIFIIMLQPDLGTTMVIASIGFSQMFFSNVISLAQMALFGFAGVAGSSLLILSSSYRRDRLITFLSQTQDPLGKGYHVRQILLALGSGGFFGVGLGQSRQKQLFLPETAADSIFAVIAEEIGFLGSLILIALLGYFVYRAILVVKRAPDTYSQVLAVGITTWITVQMFLNIGSMVALIPLTGITLPFLSYGGSSVMSILVATGILINISRYGKKE